MPAIPAHGKFAPSQRSRRICWHVKHSQSLGDIEKMKSGLFKITFFVFTILLTSCENKYNRMIEWTDNILIGMHIEQIKLKQPKFLIIDWQNPDTIKNSVLYEIKVQSKNDILRMQNFLVFRDNKFVRRESRK